MQTCFDVKQIVLKSMNSFFMFNFFPIFWKVETSDAGKRKRLFHKERKHFICEFETAIKWQILDQYLAWDVLSRFSEMYDVWLWRWSMPLYWISGLPWRPCCWVHHRNGKLFHATLSKIFFFFTLSKIFFYWNTDSNVSIIVTLIHCIWLD